MHICTRALKGPKEWGLPRPLAVWPLARLAPGRLALAPMAPGPFGGAICSPSLNQSLTPLLLLFHNWTESKRQYRGKRMLWWHCSCWQDMSMYSFICYCGESFLRYDRPLCNAQGTTCILRTKQQHIKYYNVDVNDILSRIQPLITQTATQTSSNYKHD